MKTIGKFTQFLSLSVNLSIRKNIDLRIIWTNMLTRGLNLTSNWTEMGEKMNPFINFWPQNLTEGSLGFISVDPTSHIYTSYLFLLPQFHTADFIKKVLSVYTHSMTTIYLSLSAQVAKSTFFMKSPVCL